MAEDFETALESLRKGCDAVRSLLHKTFTPGKALNPDDKSTLKFLVDQLVKDGKQVQRLIDEKPAPTPGPRRL